MMKNVTEEQKSQSYFFIVILVGVSTIIGLCFVLVNFSIDEHVVDYHYSQTKKQKAMTAEDAQMKDSQTEGVLQEESMEVLFDEGDVFVDEELLLEDKEDLEEIPVDDIVL